MEKTLKRNISLLVTLLMAVVVIGFMPQFGAGRAYAAAKDSALAASAIAQSDDESGNPPALAAGASVLRDKANAADAPTVYLADTAWKVIGYDGTGTASASGSMTLISADLIKEKVPFNNKYDARWSIPYDANHYSRSVIKKEVEAVANTFADGEKGAVVKRDLATGAYSGDNTDVVWGDEVKDALLWPLSSKEANGMNNSLRSLGPLHSKYAGEWWLRSPVYESPYVAYVSDSGSVFGSTIGNNNGSYELKGLRPAFYLNLGSVMLASAAEGGKSSGTEGVNSLKPIEANTSGAWKATLKSGHDNFAVRKVVANWGKKVIVVSYSGAATGAGEHISAIIKDSNGNVTYYGNLKSCTSAEDASGAVAINIDGKLGSGDKLYVFNEQLNGDKKTDYASELKEVAIPEAKSKNFRELTEDSPHVLLDGWYKVSKGETVNMGPGELGYGLWMRRGAKVFLYIEEGATLNVTGMSATDERNRTRRGFAAIRVDASNTLIISGKGTLNATGGNAADGEAGDSAATGVVNIDKNIARSGYGGQSGRGGGGAGAGIGTEGGTGGFSHLGGHGANADGTSLRSNTYGNNGQAGGNGGEAPLAGKVIITGSVTVNATGGAAGKGGAGGSRGAYREDRTTWIATAAGTSGGGGGGGGGSAADGIGSGGTGGGAGGSGASGNIDGECAFFKGADLDDLWSHGGKGGSSNWGGGKGGDGDEGANGGDDTSGSREHAKTGGAGGACPAPKTVAFYTYTAGGYAPKVTCKAGHGVTREATPIDVVRFEELGGDADMVGDLSAQPGELVTMSTQSVDAAALSTQAVDTTVPNAQSIDATALSAQADGNPEPAWLESGTESVEIEEGVSIEVAYKIACYDAAGNSLDAAPVEPGEYVALVRYTCPKGYEDYSGDYTVPFTIDKRQVAVPTPAALTFACENWETGVGTLQDAFPDLDESCIEFVEASKTVDGKTVSSARSARSVGSYEACFKLTDPEKCEWADGTDASEEVWVSWSIAPDTYDPNNGEVIYWGATYDDATTTVTYTGEPTWVRPWYMPMKSSGGKFPEWVTHWGDAGRPTDVRNSACVVYLNEDTQDYAGIVGYHENADGSLEPVTGAQVYAWMCGVDIDGQHVDVQSGDKVWYKVGTGDEVTVLAVQSGEPEGADGCIVARDLAYATHLGVKEAGVYQAYAFFDEEAGFVPIAPVEATITVAKAAHSIKAKAKCSVVFKAKKSGKKKVLAKKRVVNLAKKAKVSATTALTYKKANKAGGKKIAVNKKTGKVTLKKGLKKGAYKVEVELTAAASPIHEAASKTITLKVKVK